MTISPIDATLLLAAVVLGIVTLALRPTRAQVWLGALVIVGGALAAWPGVTRGVDPTSEVARLVVLLGGAGLVHFLAVVSGLRASVAPGGDRAALLAPTALYLAAFGGWLVLEVGGAAVDVGVEGSSWITTTAGLGLFAFALGNAWLVTDWGWPKRRSGAADRPPRGVGRSSDLTGESATELVRELAAAQDVASCVSALRTALQRRGVELVTVILGASDAPAAELPSASSHDPISIDPADPLYVALRARVVVATDEVDLPVGRSSPARAAVHRLGALGAHVAIPVTLGDRLVGGLLARGDERPATAVLAWLEAVAPSIGLALEAHRVRAALAAQQSLRASAPVALGSAADVDEMHGIVGASVAIRSVVERIERVAPTDAAVFVRGETGTGKERVVEAVHALSRRSERALVKIPCAALPEPLLESELFGYEPGAFTGAVDAKAGRFEAADGGTIFFDDVDTLPQGVQAKLLRALQEGEVQRLGSNKVRHVDARVVAATNRDLLEDVRSGAFREDLYYRLNVVPIELPALRERKDDIPLLVEHFLELEGGRLGRRVERIAADSLEELMAYDWPGNVRELRNVIERAVVMADGDVLHVSSPAPPPSAPGGDDPDGLGRASLPELLRRYKVRLVTRALELSGGNQREAAEMLGIHRPSLTRMVRELGLRDQLPSTKRRGSRSKKAG